MRAIDFSKWFLNKNPSLLKGDFDGNLKLNKLLYFSNLMYFSVFGKDLMSDNFEKWEKGPVIESIYNEYKDNSLFELVNSIPSITDKKTLQVLEIINFVYADYSSKELTEESHTHNIWKDVEEKGLINFRNISQDVKGYMLDLYNLYKYYDFDNIAIERVNGNKYIYFKDNLELTNDVLKILQTINSINSPAFIEMIDGELVFS